MVVNFPPKTDVYQVFRWLEENIGLYGHGWVINYLDDPYDRRSARFQSLDIDSEEDVLAYKMVYGIY